MSRLNRDRIEGIVGPLDETKMIEILETEASEAELMQAMAWLDQNDYMGKAGASPPTGVVATLCEILRSAEPEPEERR